MSFTYKEKILDWNWYDEECLDSTNNAIKQIQAENFPAVISAVKQTGGRGRRGRSWISINGNLYFTFNYEIELNELSRYVCIIGLSLIKTIISYNIDADVKIKWPNDVFFSGKKITGILIENISEKNWAIGIGVNIAGSPHLNDMPYQATSLSEQNIKTDRIDFLKKYLTQFKLLSDQYKKQGFSTIKTEWLRYALNLGREITIKNDDTIKKGIFLTLDDNGYLILKVKDNEERIIAGDLFI